MAERELPRSPITAMHDNLSCVVCNGALISKAMRSVRLHYEFKTDDVDTSQISKKHLLHKRRIITDRSGAQPEVSKADESFVFSITSQTERKCFFRKRVSRMVQNKRQMTADKQAVRNNTAVQSSPTHSAQFDMKSLSADLNERRVFMFPLFQHQALWFASTRLVRIGNVK